ncbi:hypothetical protein GCM10009715_18810 [Paeniglutamicibacter psychrophenolicus]
MPASLSPTCSSPPAGHPISTAVHITGGGPGHDFTEETGSDVRSITCEIQGPLKGRWCATA